ncbi:MAG: FMN-dependent NADH-azoreductase [Pseudonocardiaceae bacterium]
MRSLLHLDSSAGMPGGSVSRQLASLFADTWRELYPGGDYRYRDLVADPISPLVPAYTTLGRRVQRHGGVPPSRVAALVEGIAEEREWALTLPLVTELLAAGTVLIGVPMYNFSVPAALKAWIDRVTFPGAYVDPDTGAPLLRDTRVVLAIARGGGYGPGTPREAFDFQIPYLRAYFGNLGVAETGLSVVRAELTVSDIVPNLAGFRDLAASSLAAARAEMVALATEQDYPVLPDRAAAPAILG